MTDNYFIPKLEDICPGYTCEIKNSSDPVYFEWEEGYFDEDYTFIHGIYRTTHDLEQIESMIREGNIRAKTITSNINSKTLKH